jgi:predicted 2-oxoglutarate/Fe(II)-dependent dioxygenase YbiX
MKTTVIPGRNSLVVIDNLLSKQECLDLIKRADTVQDDVKGNQAWHLTDNDGSYDRVIMVDTPFAASLWGLLKRHVPTRYRGYTLVELNNHFRFSRYHKGGYFPIHCDGKTTIKQEMAKGKSRKLESVFTLNIFLNDEFDGGETEFYDLINKTTFDVRHTISPKPGRAAYFFADQYHAGKPVMPRANTKYLLRTDVMGYR